MQVYLRSRILFCFFQGCHVRHPDIYKLSVSKRDFVIDFFYEYANSATTAQLACPFFSSTDPLKILTQAGCRRIQLLVGLCEATSPVALQIAKSLPDAQVRFFDDEAFHAKFYILGQNALVGSANLTGAGLKSNRESEPRLPMLAAA